MHTNNTQVVLESRVVSLHKSIACLESGVVIDFATSTVLFEEQGIKYHSGCYQSDHCIYTDSFDRLNYTADSFVVDGNSIYGITGDTVHHSTITG